MHNHNIIEIVKKKLSEGLVDYLLNEEDYHFQKLEDLFHAYKAYDISDIQQSLVTDILEGYLANGEFSYHELLNQLTNNIPLRDFIILIGRIVSYCDDKAYNKTEWNEYNPHRVLAKAMVTMPRWLTGFINYKIQGNFDGIEPSVSNAIKYIENPTERLTMLSEKHRKLVSTYILDQPFNDDSFDRDTIQYFAAFNSTPRNPKNTGQVISRILYNDEVKECWQAKIIGLLASDTTGWQDTAIREAKNEGETKFILWNSKRPSGTGSTIAGLKNTISKIGYFDLFYVANNEAKYYAKIVDIVDNAAEYMQKPWLNNNDIYGLEQDFTDYIDDNKHANVVFLASEFIKLKSPVPVDRFRLYNGYDYPRQDNLSPIEGIAPLGDAIIVQLQNSMIEMTKLNTILYGPPGTGKTYNTINYAVAVVEGRDIDEVTRQSETEEGRNKLEELFEIYRKSGQLEFITFHQNYSYEEFVQGLRPDIDSEKEGLSFQRVDGIFKRIADRALANKDASSKSEQLLPTFDDVFEAFFSDVINNNDELRINMESDGYYFTITSYNDRLKYFKFKKRDGGDSHNISVPTLKEIYEGGRKEMIGLKPYYQPLVKEMKSFAKGMVKDKPEEKLKRYVLIIDEINRANISRVFGELITLIEPDKRWGGKHQLKLTLPSGQEFTVPDNLYIIGTMNTADKSLALLDIALRRRFSFKPMFPDKTKAYPSFQEFFSKLNDTICEEKGADFTIGHSYFMAKDNDNDPDITSIMNNEVIPLLQEYYYSDKKDKVTEIINKATENTPLSVYEAKSDNFGLVTFMPKAGVSDEQ